MLDFLNIATKYKNGVTEIYPNFRVGKNNDLMIRGGDFYAIWVEDRKLWSTDEDDAIELIDRELREYAKQNQPNFGSVKIMYMRDSDSGMIDKFHKYCQKQQRDSFNMLDENLIFSNVETKKEDYASKKLSYPLEKCPTPAWDKLMSVLYSEEERHKIEWAIGSIVTGDSKTLQKFMVLYGSAGTGKSTVLNIIQQLFEGYYSVFDAKALGSSNNSFALESFKKNPLVAIQHDGDLSKIEDNTRLNSLVSHEYMSVNEKFKSTYENRFKCFLFMGTNKPVKITDGKSGLIRRLIDVSPTGNKLSVREYDATVKKIPFELGGIAYHCKEVYLENPGVYDHYIPTTMMGATNDFYNFVIDSYSVFKKEDGTTLKAAWERYKTYCDDAKVPYPYSLRTFKEELKNYFYDYIEQFDADDGTKVRSYYKGFNTNKFVDNESEKNPGLDISKKQTDSWLDLKEQDSVFDDICCDCPAQYAKVSGTPKGTWDKCETKLMDLDTSKLHYVKVPLNHIVIDFDLKNEKGEKSYDLNIAAASSWPHTYAEVSKSGNGIHLHYIYDGDVSELNRLYADDIEIKVFTGNSALRRQLSLCNNLDISTISSGLPLRGERKKLIDKDVVITEKGLRTTIKKCLGKRIHANTKSNIDFIYKILNDAYNEGIHYDVSDLENDIFAFACNSTNNSDYCMKLVSKMHFKSDEPSPNKDTDEKPIVFFDCEVFPNLFLVNWKFEGEGKPVVRMINPKPSAIEDLLQFRLIGFNNRRYDNHMLYARLMGYTEEQLYNLSQKIVSTPKGEQNNYLFGEAYNLSYTDIYDFASAGNKKSLKKLEIEMGIHHKELGLPWDQPVPEERWIEVAEYCDNDVIATEAAFNYLKGDWTARQILADLADMTVNDTTNSLTQRIIFGKNKNPQDQFNYRNLSEPVLDLDIETDEFLREACPEMMAKLHTAAEVPFEDPKSVLPYFPGYKYENGKSTYRGVEVGEGGYVYSEPGMYGNVALLDVASMHPHSAIAECLFGVKFTKAFRDVVEGRVDIKHKAWDVVDEILGGKLRPHIQKVKNGEMSAKDLANGLKTAINAVYGQTSAKYNNPFRDIRNKDNIVAKRGALFMVDLMYAVKEKGFTVAHIKTDSIKIPDATPEIIKFVMDFGKRYGYTFEHEATYERMCLVNKAVYIAKYATKEQCEKLYGYAPGDCIDHGGEWTATGDQFAVPYVYKTLFTHDPIEFNDLCEVFEVKKGALYLDMNENLPDVSYFEDLKDYREDYPDLNDSSKKIPGKVRRMLEENASLTDDDILAEIDKGHDMQFIGRIGQFCPVKPGKGGGILYRVDNGKNSAAAGTTGYRWIESELLCKSTDEKTTVIDSETGEKKEVTKLIEINDIRDVIDRSFYDNLVNDAIDTINEYGNFEWFVSDEPYISKRVPDFMDIPVGMNEEIIFNQ